jgi:hypothetical protein
MALAASVLVALIAAPGSAANGGVTVYDDPGCAGGGNAAHVTPPFSIGITGLEPFSQTSCL